MSEVRDPGSKDALFPASAAQQRLWFLDQLNPGDVSYNMSQAYRLRGKLDRVALCDSINQIIVRHSVLRTSFVIDEHVLLQKVRSELRIDLPAVDIPTSGKEESEAVIQRLVDDELNAVFDLENGPLFRAILYRLAPQDHLLLISQHHIIFDRTSVGLLVREMNTLYESYKSGDQSAEAVLPALKIQYHDHAKWKIESSQGEALTRPLEYWREQLGGMVPLEIPTDRARSRLVTTKGGQVYCDLPGGAVEGVAEIARANGATPFIGLLTAFKVLLHQWTGSDDISVGTPISDRRLDGSKELLGFFVNNLVLRADVSDELDFTALVQSERKTCFAAYRHSSVPFEKLVEIAKPSRQENRNPLFDVHFAFQKKHTSFLCLGDVSIEELNATRSTAQYDVMLTVREQSDGYDVRVEYRTDLFEEETINRLMRRYGSLLEVIVANPALKLSEYPLITQDEYQEITGDWNDTAIDYENSDCILRFIDEQVRRSPEKIILESDQGTMTYGELDRRSNQLARFLRKHGIGKDVLVGLCVERSTEMIVSLVGILKSGGAYVPLDPEYPPERLGFMAEDADAPVLLTQEKLLGYLPEMKAKVVCLDRDWDKIAAESDESLDIEIDPDSLAYVIYTSGSTGRPKGAMNEHRAICNRLVWMQSVFDLTNDDVVFQKTPFSFDVSVWELFLPLMTGARMVILKPGGHHDPTYLAQQIDEKQITMLHFVPSMLQVFLDQSNLKSLCKSVRVVVCSGEALAHDLQERFFTSLDSELHNLYGPTEAAIDVTHWECRRDSNEAMVPIGRPVANTQIHILDKNLRPVPAGAEGELHIGGVQVGRGYLNRDNLTQERFIEDPFSSLPGARLYKTGDLARWRLDGAIEYRGRIDFQVKVRGLRIELGEIEVAIVDCGLAQQVVVIVREDREGDLRIVAYYVLEQEQQVDGSEFRARLQKRLPAYMIPQYFVAMPSLPLTSSGKVDRKALPAPDLNIVSGSEEYVAPRTIAEIRLASIWQDLLGISKVGVRDNFIELGGHSLLALQAISRIKQEEGAEIHAMSMIMDTLEQIAAQFDTESSISDDSEQHDTSKGKVSPLFFGPDDSLLGLHHEPSSKTKRDTCILICGPIYLESITAHWAIKRLADQLASHGYHVLRFDYFGSGDSHGDSSQGNVPRWMEDVQSAAKQLLMMADVGRVSVVGLRFGATLAANSKIDKLNDLVLWDPIVNGADYMEHMRGRHDMMVAASNALRSKPVVESDSELLGYVCPPETRRMIGAINLTEAFEQSAERVNLVVTKEGRGYESLQEAMESKEMPVIRQVIDDARCEIYGHAKLKAFMPGETLRAIISIFLESGK